MMESHIERHSDRIFFKKQNKQKSMYIHFFRNINDFNGKKKIKKSFIKPIILFEVVFYL